MLQPKLEVPAELRNLTEKAIEQTEQAFRGEVSPACGI